MSGKAIDYTDDSIRLLQSFLLSPRRQRRGKWLPAVSLFSGAGISDIGYERAGFRFLVHVEVSEARASIGVRNFPESEWIMNDLRSTHKRVVESYWSKCGRRPSLLVATPPCQGMSSSNPSRGKRKTLKARQNDDKNSLIMAIVPVAQSLRPRVIVSENVRQILTHTLRRGNKEVCVYRLLADALPEYQFFNTRVNVADYGIPQMRHRALIVAIHREERWLQKMVARRKAPWPRKTHSENVLDGHKPWVTVRRWLEAINYPSLSSRSPGEAHDGDPLHFVPHYGADRYSLVEDIPPHSGQSAYENHTCRTCGTKDISRGLASCPVCGGPMRNRPIVLEKTGARLIKGFDSSYRRMKPDEPAPTVTTNSSHIGSDNKIHPWEHRVLSILECADLQTVPRVFDWSDAFASRRTYLIRNVIGEAFPSYFTYLHGCTLAGLIRGTRGGFTGLASSLD